MSNFATDGPNYEAVFRGMKCLHGGNSEDVKIIVRFLRFFQGTEEYQTYLNHYLPMLPEGVAAEFKPKDVKVEPEAEKETVAEVKEEPKVEPDAAVADEPVDPIPVPKKRGRSSK